MKPIEYKTTASFLIPILQAADSRGIEIKQIVNFNPKNMSGVSIPGNFICIKKLDDLINQLIEKQQDPDFILDIARNIQPVTFLGLGYVMMSANNVRDALKYMIEYHRLISNFSELTLIEQRDSFHFTYKPGGDPETGYSLSQFSMLSFIAVLIQLLRMITNHKFAPLSIAFKAAESKYFTKAFQQFVNCELDFAKDETVIVFDKQQCLKPLYTANPSLLQTHKIILDRQVSLIDKLDIVSQVEDQIHELLPNGGLSQNNIAANLHMSLRNLQRQLKLRGTNYRDLVENTRKNLAFKYMHEPDLSLGEISYLLGFSTHSNFNRAFKRWSEFSPNLYRNRVVFQPFIESKH